MTTEAKVREAFQVWLDADNGDYNFEFAEDAFIAGYMALLNELESSYLVRDNDMLYRLPEGVEKP